ncbi:MAG: hypothetical protein LBG64_01885 [Pseudomonadales bacterium]|jgi:hypothetical protein|nr:hypothetical protein [Pseudomonadales bacterium]
MSLKRPSLLGIFVFLMFVVGVLVVLRTGTPTDAALPAQAAPNDNLLPARSYPTDPTAAATTPTEGRNNFDDPQRISESFTEGLTTPATPNAARTTLTHTSYTFRALTCFILGGCAQGATTGAPPPSDGALGQTLNLIASTYTPPASAEIYIADVLRNIGVETTLAQGYGYVALTPLLSMWRLFRNIAYVFFTLIIIVVGFIILFRQKIGGQAVVTVQQALPRIVLALILVTFSYAIAGLVVDLMYLVMYAYASLLVTDARADLLTGNFGFLFDTMTSGGAGSVGSVVADFIDSALGAWSMLGLVSAIGGTLMTLVVAIAQFYAALHVLFILVTSYVFFLLGVVLGPVVLMFGAIPGVNTFKKWLRSLVANLAVFPATMFIISFHSILINSLSGGSASSASGQVYAQGVYFIPPYIIGTDIAASDLAAVLSLGLMLALPTILKKVKTVVGGGEGFMGEMAGAVGNSLNRGWNSAPMRLGRNVVKGGAMMAGGLAVKAGARRAIGGMQAGNKLSEQSAGIADARNILADPTRSAEHGAAAQRLNDLQTQQVSQIEMYGNDTQRKEATRFQRAYHKLEARRAAGTISQANYARQTQDLSRILDRSNTSGGLAGAYDAVKTGERQRRQAFLEKHGIFGGMKKSVAAGEYVPGVGGAIGLLPSVRKEKRVFYGDFIDKTYALRQEANRINARPAASRSENEKERLNNINDWLAANVDKYSGDMNAASNAFHQKQLRGEGNI